MFSEIKPDGLFFFFHKIEIIEIGDNSEQKNSSLKIEYGGNVDASTPWMEYAEY